MWWCLGLLFLFLKGYSTLRPINDFAVVFYQMLSDLFHVFGGPLEVFAAPLLKALDAKFVAVFDDFYVLFPYWIILSLYGIEWN